MAITVINAQHNKPQFGFGKRQQGVTHGPGGCLNESDVGLTTGHDMNNDAQQPSLQELTSSDVFMERSQVSIKLGLICLALLEELVLCG